MCRTDVMRTTVPTALLFFCLFFAFECRSEHSDRDNTDNNPYEFHIGGVLSSNASENYFKQTIEVTPRGL